MIQNNYPSLYDENMFLGETGFSVILNLVQLILFLFSTWSTYVFSKEIFNIYNTQSPWIFGICIGAFVGYFLLYTFLISITIRWYTLIASIETRRNDKCLKKTINHQMASYSQISQSISYAFKKLFYDNVYEKDQNNNPFKLSINNFRKKLNFYIKRFKGLIGKNINNFDETPIEFDIKTELPVFLRSCGMELTEEEYDFMLHISGDKKNLMDQKLNHTQLHDVWAAINYFCSKPMHEIVRKVFEDHSLKQEENNKKSDLEAFDEKKITDFLIYYKEYFPENLSEFMIEEVSYLGTNFTIDAFIFRILGYGSLNSF